jgi:Tfp pilus assembly protein PilV
MEVAKMLRVLKKIQAGIGLIEVIVALGIAVVVITALVSLSVFTLRSSLQSKLLLEGTKIANREIELVRAYRDQSLSWAAFINGMDNCFTSCYMSLDGLVVNSGVGVENSGLEQVEHFFRAESLSGTIVTASDQEVRIEVTARWNIGGELKQTQIFTDLTNWRGL